MNYTPGPWQALQEDKGRNELSRRHHGKNPIYRVESANLGHGFVGYFRRKRDALLASAAPELLEELREMLYYAREAYSWHGGDEETRGYATEIKADIDRVEALLLRIEQGEDRSHDQS